MPLTPRVDLRLAFLGKRNGDDGRGDERSAECFGETFHRLSKHLERIAY
jgi:hypothetical protein